MDLTWRYRGISSVRCKIFGRYLVAIWCNYSGGVVNTSIGRKASASLP